MKPPVESVFEERYPTGGVSPPSRAETRRAPAVGLVASAVRPTGKRLPEPAVDRSSTTVAGGRHRWCGPGRLVDRMPLQFGVVGRQGAWYSKPSGGRYFERTGVGGDDRSNRDTRSCGADRGRPSVADGGEGRRLLGVLRRGGTPTGGRFGLAELKLAVGEPGRRRVRRRGPWGDGSDRRPRRRSGRPTRRPAEPLDVGLAERQSCGRRSASTGGVGVQYGIGESIVILYRIVIAYRINPVFKLVRKGLL